MIAYHIDRSGRLRPGQIIHGIQCNNVWGLEYLSEWGYGVNSFTNKTMYFQTHQQLQRAIHTQNIEAHVEQCRKTHFPYMPSRLSSFFGVEKIEDFKFWEGILDSPSAKIYEVSYEGVAFKFDAAYLNLFPRVISSINPKWGLNDINQLNQSTFEYWCGKMSANPLPELLIPLPVTVVREVSLDPHP